MPGALLNGAISTYNLKLIACSEGILPMLIAGQMINSHFALSVHRGGPTFILPRQRREDAGKGDAGTLGSQRFRGTGKEQAQGKGSLGTAPSHGPLMPTKFEQQQEFPPVAPPPSQAKTLVPGRMVGFTPMLPSPGDLPGPGFSPLPRLRTWQELTSRLVPAPALWV